MMMRMRVILLSAISLALTAPAYAQFGQIVSDPLTEQNTGATASELSATNADLGIADQDLGLIVTADQTTATSVTTGGGAGFYTNVSGFLDNETNVLGSGNVTAQAMQTLFPGYVALNPDNQLTDTTIVADALTTYEAAEQTAEDQAADFDNESANLQSIEAANAGSVALLNAVEVNTEAVLAVAEQIQLERGLIISMIRIASLNSAEPLNRVAQLRATDAETYNEGFPPQ